MFVAFVLFRHEQNPLDVFPEMRQKSSMDQYLERVVDLTEPTANQIYNMTVDEARALLLHGPPEKVREIEGSFSLVARAGTTVKLARSLDQPMRYFLAKRVEGPALIVAHRIDTIRDWL